jgi:hypothetical protein
MPEYMMGRAKTIELEFPTNYKHNEKFIQLHIYGCFSVLLSNLINSICKTFAHNEILIQIMKWITNMRDIS